MKKQERERKTKTKKREREREGRSPVPHALTMQGFIRARCFVKGTWNIAVSGVFINSRCDLKIRERERERNREGEREKKKSVKRGRE